MNKESMTDKQFIVTVNELEAQTIRRIINYRPHTTDISIRKDGHNHALEGDWIKRMVEIPDYKG